MERQLFATRWIKTVKVCMSLAVRVAVMAGMRLSIIAALKAGAKFVGPLAVVKEGSLLAQEVWIIFKENALRSSSVKRAQKRGFVKRALTLIAMKTTCLFAYDRDP